MHSRDGHVPELQWEVMSSNEATTVQLAHLCLFIYYFVGILHTTAYAIC
jgi:hypothetical protein